MASEADTYGATAPVAITGCATFAGTPVSAFDTIAFANFGSYSISFVNRSSVVANHVALEVNAGGTMQRIDQNGSFAPGTRIDTDSQPFFSSGDARASLCSVVEVDFANGTSWHAAPATALTTPALASEVANS